MDRTCPGEFNTSIDELTEGWFGAMKAIQLAPSSATCLEAEGGSTIDPPWVGPCASMWPRLPVQLPLRGVDIESWLLVPDEPKSYPAQALVWRSPFQRFREWQFARRAVQEACDESILAWAQGQVIHAIEM